MYKTCVRCEQSFPATLEHFSRDSQRQGGLRHYCKKCDTVVRLSNSDKKRPARKDLVDSVRNMPCVVCGVVDYDLIDLHHIEPPKKMSKGRRWAWAHLVNGTVSEEVFLTELVKCVPLCANDHKLVHVGRIALDNVDRLRYDDLAERLERNKAAYEREERAGQKFCTSCKMWKPEKDFYADRSKGARGKQSRCKSC